MIIWEVRSEIDGDLHYFSNENDAYAYAMDYIMTQVSDEESLRALVADLILDGDSYGVCSIGCAEVCEHYMSKRGDA